MLSRGQYLAALGKRVYKEKSNKSLGVPVLKKHGTAGRLLGQDDSRRVLQPCNATRHGKKDTDGYETLHSPLPN